MCAGAESVPAAARGRGRAPHRSAEHPAFGGPGFASSSAARLQHADAPQRLASPSDMSFRQHLACCSDKSGGRLIRERLSSGRRRRWSPRGPFPPHGGFPGSRSSVGPLTPVDGRVTPLDSGRQKGACASAPSSAGEWRPVCPHVSPCGTVTLRTDPRGRCQGRGQPCTQTRGGHWHKPSIPE